MAVHPPSGIADPIIRVERLFTFQHDLVSWALRRGRAAVFADTGLGKTGMQVAWADAVARHTSGDVMILAPLAVAAQTVAEGAACGVEVTLCREASDVRPGVNITNYDRLHRFDASRFSGVVLDESSCIKHHDAKTLRVLLDSFSSCPFRFCATATPAPNDWTELGTHAEFLGVCTRSEMLSEFFCHDGGETQVWRLKGHARKAFWRWVSSWGAMVRRPSDLGYSDDGYALPAAHTTSHTVATDAATLREGGVLFAQEAASLMDRRNARRGSIDARVSMCADLVNSEAGEPWIVWCDLNAESEALTKAIRGAVEVRGSDDADTKEERLRAFADGRIRVLVTKPSIAGFGLNWQHCARVAFVGVTDSWEAYYQAVRRCWRFGQKREVRVHIFASEAEGSVVANLARKERDAAAMADSLSAETRDAVMAEVRGAVRTVNTYEARKAIRLPSWLKSESEVA
jgi:superfamily II DNA or RNA helicase